jgi:hypothetical protein
MLHVADRTGWKRESRGSRVMHVSLKPFSCESGKTLKKMERDIPKLSFLWWVHQSLFCVSLYKMKIWLTGVQRTWGKLVIKDTKRENFLVSFIVFLSNYYSVFLLMLAWVKMKNILTYSHELHHSSLHCRITNKYRNESPNPKCWVSGIAHVFWIFPEGFLYE